jgi:DNA uptake protein ComE-like DNA-binding protein
MELLRLVRTAAVCSALAFGATHAAQAQTLTAPTPATPAKPATPATPGLTAPTTPAAPATAAKQVTGKVNINTASASELDALPNVGDKRSAAIIKGRPYKSTDELVSKKVLSKGVFDSIKKHITI